MIRAVLFDLDDTLFDHAHCARSALAGLRDLHPCLASLDDRTLERTHCDILEVLHLEVLAGRLGLDAARVERFRRLYVAAGAAPDDALAMRTAAAYREGYLAARREVAGAAALLRAVRERARVVVVSNNLLEEQREKLRHCGLAPLVDVLVVSEEAGVAKPDRRIFEVALERAGCDPADAVMLGDSWPNDVLGARGAGIRAVWFNPAGDPPPDRAVATVRSLEPATAVLDVLGLGGGRPG